MDVIDDSYSRRFTVHSVLHSYGVALLDNAYLAVLARVCTEENRYEFMITVLPLNIERGTGSPANPLAML